MVEKHKHRCQGCGRAWSHALDGESHVRKCPCGLVWRCELAQRFNGAATRMTSLKGGAGNSGPGLRPDDPGADGQINYGPIGELMRGVVGGVNELGELGRRFTKPIFDLIEEIGKANTIVKVALGAGIYLYARSKVRPQRVEIVNPRPRARRRRR